MTARWDALILAGGRSSRLGGIPKPHLVFEGMSLLERAFEATTDAVSRVVVGGGSVPSADVVQVQELPRWAGPAAAVAAGIAALRDDDGADFVVVLAADLPHVGRAVPFLTQSLNAGGEWDGWIATDPQGRPQPLLAAYRRDALARRCTRLGAEGTLTGASVRLLITGLRLRPVAVPAELCRDIDTPADAHDFAIALPTRLETA